MRLGAGEARYKGNQLFLDLVEHLRESTQIIPCLMGRGTTEDQTKWEAQGFEVHLNADDAEKAAYLANLDVFVSPSQWEGFNLPVVEAQALGTVGIAFDVGAHPETTPIVATCLDDAASMILAWDRHRDRLERISGQVREYVLRKYKWDNTARDFSALLDETLARGTKNTFTVPSKSRMRRLWNLIRREGLIRSGVIVAKRVRQRMGRK
jgi:glycosyltransferase involved in cell wall biosynthesis